MGGYPLDWRRDVLIAAFRGYKRIWALEAEGKGHINRPEHASRLKRRAAKLTGKADWFQRAKSNTPNEHVQRGPNTLGSKKNPQAIKKRSQKIPPKIESILFCPFTPFSALRKRLQEEEDRMNGSRPVCRVKVVERAGPKMSELLNNKIPWKSEHCGRPSCPPCKTKTGKCKTPNVTYKLKCEECSKVGKTALYIGESARTFWDRASDHQKALVNKDSSYGIVRHWQEWHPELEGPPEFSYHLLGTHKSALERQIKEALAVEMTVCDVIMNGKGEWGQNLIPRLQNAPLEVSQKPQNEHQFRSKRGSDGFTKTQHENTLQEPGFVRNSDQHSSAPSHNQTSFLSQFKQRKRAKFEQASTERKEGTDQWSSEATDKRYGTPGPSSRATSRSDVMKMTRKGKK